MILKEETGSAVDISSGYLALEHQLGGTEHRLISVRVSLSNIVGGGGYDCDIAMNGVDIFPASQITVGSGATEAEFQSRQLIMRPNDTVAVTLDGLSGDTAVDVIVTLADVTPITASEMQNVIITELEASISQTVTNAVSDIEVTVRPTRTVLGVCSRQVRQMPQRLN